MCLLPHLPAPALLHTVTAPHPRTRRGAPLTRAAAAPLPLDAQTLAAAGGAAGEFKGERDSKQIAAERAGGAEREEQSVMGGEAQSMCAWGVACLAGASRAGGVSNRTPAPRRESGRFECRKGSATWQARDAGAPSRSALRAASCSSGCTLIARACRSWSMSASEFYLRRRAPQSTLAAPEHSPADCTTRRQ